jgi:hypothetical protein
MALLFLAACGRSGAGDAAPEPGTRGEATPAVMQVSEADNLRTIPVRLGDRIEVSLHAQDPSTQWAQPETSDRRVLAPAVDTKAAAARGVTLAAFTASAPGTATITSSWPLACQPGCQPKMTFQVAVAVAGRG